MDALTSEAIDKARLYCRCIFTPKPERELCEGCRRVRRFKEALGGDEP